LFISIDQEGGVVARLKEPFTVFEGNPRMADTKDAKNFARITATELSDIGVNMNMAPVLDVSVDAEKSIMADRVFGSDPQRVSRLGVTVIQHLQKNGIMSVAKHFPGIGRTTLDSHLEQPLVDTDASTLENSDLLPFAAAIKSGVACMMLSHVCFTQFDDRWPASLSRKVAGDLLRRRMGFKGVVMTDDLDMGAIKKYFDIETSMNRILHAEIDIALICHRSPDIETALKCILAFQSASKTRRKTCEQSVNRILKLKKQYLS
jgi:beta-N-acetylhexosaminidase